MKFSERLFLDKHHRIERFAVMFLTLALALLVVFVSTFFSQKDLNETTLLTQGKFSTSFQFSLSETKGSVVNVFRNSDFTRAFVLLHLDSTKNMSYDADDYSLFLTGSNLNQGKTELLCNPQAKFYMFGSTGYMGVYLVDVNGFQPQVLNLIIRANRMLVTGGNGGDLGKKDSSFAEFDQARIFFNPGGTDCIECVALNEGDLSAFSIYDSMIALGSELDLRIEMTNTLKAMQESLLHIDEYSKRVAQNGIIVPNAPLPIRGDVVTGPDDRGYYHLETEFLNAKGFDFDWINRTVRDGWLDELCPDGNYVKYFNEKKLEPDQILFNAEDRSIKWYMSDGTEFDMSMSDNVGNTSVIKSGISDLKAEWANYNRLKKTFQVDQMKKLLLMEVDARNIEDNYTENSKDTVDLRAGAEIDNSVNLLNLW